MKRIDGRWKYCRLPQHDCYEPKSTARSASVIVVVSTEPWKLHQLKFSVTSDIENAKFAAGSGREPSLLLYSGLVFGHECQAVSSHK